MTIQEVKQQLTTASNPVARILHKGDGFKVLVIGFNAGMIMKEHTAQMKAKLTCLEGSVRYVEVSGEVLLTAGEEVDIPVGIVHGVEAITDSLCLLTQGN